MNTFCFLAALIALIAIKNANGDECLSENSTYFHTKYARQITAERYVSGVFHQEGSFYIPINTTKVRALAYDYRHSEILFVDDEKPDAIWGGSPSIDLHLILYEKDIQFDCIATDPVTNNLYFADNNRGIGVCFIYGAVINCTLLISNDKTTRYHNLIVYWQRGVMFWIEKAEGEQSEVKMASMNGHRIRSLSYFKLAQSIALSAELDIIYVSRFDGIVKMFTVRDRLTYGVYFSFKPTEIYYFNCTLYGIQATDDTPSDFLNVDFPDEVIMTVIESDRMSTKSNPCRQFKCDGICVLGESYSEPTAECVPITFKPKMEVVEEEKFQEKLLECTKVERNPVNGLFIFTTILLCIALACLVALIASPQLRLELRYRIPYLANIKFFDSPYQSGEDSTALANF